MILFAVVALVALGWFLMRPDYSDGTTMQDVQRVEALRRKNSELRRSGK